MRYFMLLVVLLCVHSAWCAEDGLKEKVDSLIHKLSAESFEERQAATADLEKLPGEAYAFVEQQLASGKLDPESATRASKALRTLHSKAELLIAEKVRKQILEYYRSSTIAAYDSVGHKDPRWDDDARKAIEALAQVWSKYTYDPHVEVVGVAAAQRAVKAGCDDPFVIYIAARLADSNPAEQLRLYRAAKDNIEKYNYPPLRKSYVYLRLAETIVSQQPKPLNNAVRAEVLKYWQSAVELLSFAAAENDAHPELKAELITEPGIAMADFYMENFEADRKIGIDKIVTALIAVAPRSAAPHMIKGEAYISYAWDARGSGYANTVTQEGWRLMRERLEISADELDEGWRLQPSTKVALQRIQLELGRNNGRDQMELWFNRAMELNPNCNDACSAKMYYLEPKWHGSEEAMLEFGRQCLAKGNWRSRIPLQLASAHANLAKYADSEATYYKNPAVWQDIKAVYDGYLQFDPTSTYDRNYYALYACLCGQWADANTQFQALGAKANPSIFGGAQKLASFKTYAATFATPAAK